jgi:hypothetical protein
LAKPKQLNFRKGQGKFQVYSVHNTQNMHDDRRLVTVEGQKINENSPPQTCEKKNPI